MGAPLDFAAGAADGLLLELVKTRSEPALAALYDRHGRLVYSLVLRVVGSVPEAEELTQEVFLKLWELAASFDPARGSFPAWLAVIARRTAIDRTRSKNFRARKNEVPLEENEPAGYAGAVTASGALQALEALSPEQQRLIEWSYLDGLSHSKIAALLGAPLGTVKTRLRQAIQELREILITNGKV